MAEFVQEGERLIEMEERKEEVTERTVLNSLKEFEMLDVLLSKIPKKAQSKFLMTCDLILTCIDVDSSYIVLGSNVGLVFVFSREDSSIQRIKVTSMANMITSVKLHQGTDHLLAVATSTGYFTICCFPGKTSPLKKKEVKKFEVKDLHKYYITCLEWSTNGMKLYSGDTKGHVVITQVDFFEDTCKSVMLLIDAGNEIVQLSYDHKVLAVSTSEKCYIVRLDLNDQISNIGDEDYKMEGKFGICFVPGLCKIDDVKVYASRPGCFLWTSDIKGDIKNAQSFSSLSPEMPEIVIHSLDKTTPKPAEKFQFGRLRMFRDKEIVTWSARTLMILDPCGKKVVASLNNFEHIVDVAVVMTGEIFVLQRNSTARVIRIADKPDFKLGKAYQASLPLDVPPPLISKSDEKVGEHNSNAALSFLKNNLVNPLKKLDHHINNESGRQMNSYNIPDAKISKPEEQNYPSGREEIKFDVPQAVSLNENIGDGQSDERGSIVFSRKGKKHKKKGKNGNPTPVKEEKKEDSHGVVNAEDSTLHALQRADSLLDRLTNLNGVVSQDQCQGDQLDVQNATSQGVMSEQDTCDDVIGRSTKVEDLDTINNKANDQICNSDAKTDTMEMSLASSESYSERVIDNRSTNTNRLDESKAYSSWSSIMSEDSSSACIERAFEEIESKNGTNSDDPNVEVEGEHSIINDTLTHSHVIDSNQDFTDTRQRTEIVASPSDELIASSYLRSDSTFDNEPVMSRPSFDESSSTSEPNDAVTLEMQSVTPIIDSNIWLELKTPTNIYSVSSSDFHIWYTDKKDNIYFGSREDGQGIKWKEAPGKANQISVSPSGHVIRCLHKNAVFASTKIGIIHPKELKLVEVMKDMDCVSVDNNCVWYITRLGNVKIEMGLSPHQPLNRPEKVKCSHKLKFILCRYGVVWAITDQLQLLVRKGVTIDCPQGKQWEIYARNEPPFMFTSISIGHDEVGWAVDILGQVWFCTGVTMDNPCGCGKWWQVPLSESMVYDSGTIQLIREVSQQFDPVKFSLIISTSRGGLITAGTHGVCVNLDFKDFFYACCRSIQGYQWNSGVPSDLPSSSSWKHVCASISHSKRGMVWAQHVNKDLYAFKQARGDRKIIEENHDFICMSANLMTVWALTFEGQIMAREGITNNCPEGTGWKTIAVEQLAEVDIVHMCCSNMYVWAVASDGSIYHRIGAHVDRPDELSPIWLHIECFSNIVFTKIFAGPESWMVWAIDNRRLIYTRRGVTDMMPIGKEWVHVTGIQAMGITLTNSGVWVLSTSGEIYYRQNVTKAEITGTHWKKIPGLFSKISASANDDLWGITMDGELQQCNVQHIFEDSTVLLQVESLASPNEEVVLEWELV